MTTPARKLRIAIVTSHAIQYHTPWFRGLAQRVDLHVYFMHAQSRSDQAVAGYGVAFDWDIDLTAGYASSLLHNVAKDPNVYRFAGCDTPEIATWLRDGGFDAVIVTGWYLKSYWQTVIACHRYGIPVLVRGDSQLSTPRGMGKRAAKQLAYRIGLRQFSGFLSVGARNREYLEHYGARAERIFSVPHFVDAQLYREHTEPAARAAARAELGVSDDRPVALFVGRLIDFKRPADVIEAVARLSAGGRRIHAAFVGSGPLAGELERKAQQLNVSATQVGFRNQSALPQLYSAADVLVLPSDGNETWGLVVNEGMGCGLPAVVSEAAGCAPDMIVPGRTGHSYPCGDVARLAEAIDATLARCPRAHARDALAEVSARHSCERAVEGTLAALRALVPGAEA